MRKNSVSWGERYPHVRTDKGEIIRQYQKQCLLKREMLGGRIACRSMAEIARLSGSIDWIDLYFVERERIPGRAIKLGIQMHVAILSILNTIFIADIFGV